MLVLVLATSVIVYAAASLGFEVDGNVDAYDYHEHLDRSCGGQMGGSNKSICKRDVVVPGQDSSTKGQLVTPAVLFTTTTP